MTNVVALPGRKRVRLSTENRKVLPKRGRNADRRSREYLTPDEAAKLIEHAGSSAGTAKGIRPSASV